ncbi:2-dehydropantoate 2-reductase [Caulobacter hibisci]|uniref:2-dehydropantoate 2-reductase n=1 Tax=Caulobacter hibisci TaxID=2035993 RepID=A0ABS0T4L0_9CAUL|nr:2-dehydropantoate 2-reductase [Caulobacter hibisci]MBI1686025.1 2-dehydropantoate 2-reductase [Caulobacter hibisci]
MRIAVIGPGAVGGTLAAWLSLAHEVTLCVRTAFERLEVETPERTLVATPTVLTDPAQATSVDWVLIATKTYDAAGAAAWLAGLVGPGTRVAVLQNGVEHVERFTPYLPAERITPAVVDIPAERTAPGVIRQRRLGWIKVPAGEAGQAFADLFAHTPIAVEPTDEFKAVAWRKLALNCAGAVNALALKPSGISRRDDIAAIMRDLMAECIAVGRAEDVDLPDSLPDEVVAGYRSGPADGVNSLLADRLAGRPMEIDARNGVIVRRGAAHGVPTPVNAMIVALLEAAGE